MNAAYIIAGFSVGILGSFHCIGMCGPIAMALPVHKASTWKRNWYIFLYNLGRTSTYSFLGLLFGIIGATFFIGKYQQAFSITAGILILLFLLFSKLHLPGNKLWNRYVLSVKSALSNLFQREKNGYLYFLIGLYNGLLPCGLVYMAIAGALSTGNVLNSVLFMAAFGAGTFPVMFSVSVFSKYISVQVRTHIRKAVPVFIGAMAILLILRGLNLGIPYLSPELKATPTGTHSCCHKE